MPERSHQTVRICGLPEKTVTADIHNFLINRNIIVTASQAIVGPICDQAESALKQTTVSFTSQQDCAAKVLGLAQNHRQFTCVDRTPSSQGRTTLVQIDAHFMDMTTICSANNPATGKPDIDIVVTHGLAGHAWNSFTTWTEVRTGQYREINWLRDILPGHLAGYERENGRRGIYPRILLFGYNANIWTKALAHADFNDAVRIMILGLDRERRQDPHRPLFFIAHSLGGIVVKSVIVSLLSQLIGTDPQGLVESPIKGCLFFGVPHKGSGVAGAFAPTLIALGTFLNVSGRNVDALRGNSVILSDNAEQFHIIRSDYNIPVVSCYELDRDVRKIIVPQASAILQYDGCPTPVPLYKNHREMVKFENTSDAGFLSAIDGLANIAKAALASRERQSSLDDSTLEADAEPTFSGREENLLSSLRRFDTVFLIDDSQTMAGAKWALVRAILDRATKIATKYDDDGIDIQFLNDENHNRKHITSSTLIMQILASVTPNGSTPLGAQLQKHLRAYLSYFEEQERKRRNSARPRNLIILTDGIPDEPKKRIEKTIVNTARALDRENAVDEQLGIQFCVIGNEPGVAEFYSALDNDLEESEHLNRDMVDWIQCVNDSDLTDRFFVKLLVGGWNKTVDEQNLEATIQPPPQRLSERPTPTTTW